MKGRGAEIDIIFKLIALISGHKEIFSGAGDVVIMVIHMQKARLTRSGQKVLAKYSTNEAPSCLGLWCHCSGQNDLSDQAV